MKLNQKIPLKYSIIILFIMLIFTLFMPIETIECSKSNDSCHIYTRKVFGRNQKLKTSFKISDITDYKIFSYSGGRSGKTHYNLRIFLKDGRVIDIDNGTSSYERAEEILYDMRIQQNFKLKGSYFKTLSNGY